MRAGIQIGLVVLCLVPGAAFTQTPNKPTDAAEVFSHILEKWEHERFWYMRPAVPERYVEGARLSMLMFWNEDMAGYCSCEFEECREFLLTRRVRFSETDNVRLPQPCDLYTASAWYLADRSRALGQRSVVEVWQYPDTPPIPEPRAPPASGPTADELARVGPVYCHREGDSVSRHDFSQPMRVVSHPERPESPTAS